MYVCWCGTRTNVPVGNICTHSKSGGSNSSSVFGGGGGVYAAGGAGGGGGGTSHAYAIGNGGVFGTPTQINVQYESYIDHAIPWINQEEPVKAWKWAVLLLNDSQPFTGYGQGGMYKTVDTYRHHDGIWNGTMVMPSVSHPVEPEHILHCHCGFYGLKERPEKEAGGNLYWLLEVELYGLVVDCEHGYRAAKQRVLSATAPWCCKEASRHHDFRGIPTVDGQLKIVPHCWVPGKIRKTWEKITRRKPETANLDRLREIVGVEIRGH
jgi:hypothetical protein